MTLNEIQALTDKAKESSEAARRLDNPINKSRPPVNRVSKKAKSSRATVILLAPKTCALKIVTSRVC